MYQLQMFNLTHLTLKKKKRPSVIGTISMPSLQMK